MKKLDHHRLLSGDQVGVSASAARAGLWVASGAYQLAARWRRWRYDSGRSEIIRVDAPVISVGNLTTGGTGKTPVVCDLSKRLRAMNRRVAIVSRGYGAGDSGVNDEAMELNERLPDVPHVQNPDRVAAAMTAIEELESEVIVMDDGFQHRRLHRDLDVVVIDATNPFGYNHLLPRGYLREPISSLKRADLVILSRADQADVDPIEATIRRHHQSIPILRTTHQPTGLRQFDGTVKPIETLKDLRIGALSAIGNPNAFVTTLNACGGNVMTRFDLPDHDPYERATREHLRHWIQTTKPIDLIVCTHKDAVKLATDSIGGVPLACLQIDLCYQSPTDVLDEALSRILIPSTARGVGHDDHRGRESESFPSRFAGRLIPIVARPHRER